jgi:hypothetical protein
MKLSGSRTEQDIFVEGSKRGIQGAHRMGDPWVKSEFFRVNYFQVLGKSAMYEYPKHSRGCQSLQFSITRSTKRLHVGKFE